MYFLNFMFFIEIIYIYILQIQLQRQLKLQIQLQLQMQQEEILSECIEEGWQGPRRGIPHESFENVIRCFEKSVSKIPESSKYK